VATTTSAKRLKQAQAVKAFAGLVYVTVAYLLADENNSNICPVSVVFKPLLYNLYRCIRGHYKIVGRPLRINFPNAAKQQTRACVL